MESETIKILEELGLEYRGKLKMGLAIAPECSTLRSHISVSSDCSVPGGEL
jgi:hypothetical protein